jgi:DNA-binding PadR family transcriptional regulator
MYLIDIYKDDAMPRSRTPYVILGLLSVEPMTGYDLRQTIERTVGHFWSESYGQLYPALRRLRDDGLILGEETAGGRRKVRYTITEAGRTHLIAWLQTPAEPTPPRNELLLKVFFGAHDPAAILTELRRAQAASRAEGARMAAIAALLRDQEADAPELPYWLTTLDLGERVARARAEWADAAIARLEDR